MVARTTMPSTAKMGATTSSAGPGGVSLEGGPARENWLGRRGEESFLCGNDYIYDDFDPGNDTGSDRMDGGDGNDKIFSSNGNDKIYGRAGDDTITIQNYAGHNHFDDSLEIHGGSGADMLIFSGDGTVTS